MGEPQSWRELLYQVHARVDRGDGIALVDGAGRTEYVSPAVRRMLGYAEDDLVGAVNGVKMHPDDAPAARAGYEQLLREPGSTRTFIARVLHKDGSYRWIETTATNFLEDPSIGAVMTHFRDVTETMTVRRALDETRRRYESLLSATSAVIYSCAVDAPYGATFVSENVEAMLGHAAERFVREPGFWADNVHPDDREHVLSAHGRTTCEYRFRRADGSYAWLHDDVRIHRDAGGAPYEMVGVLTDVSSRHEMESALRRSEANFRLLVERAPLAVLVHRGETIQYVNPAMARLLGAPADALVGTPAWSIVPAPYRATVEERLAVLVQTPGNPHVPRIEAEFARADGSLVAVEVEAIKLDFDGLPSFVVLARDISDRRAMLARLAASDRLASLGVLAAGLAHEINNPLAFLQTNLHLLTEQMTPTSAAPRFDDAEIASILSDARDGAKRIESLVRDLRSFARSDAADAGPVDVREVLESCMRMAQNEIRPRANLVPLVGDVPLATGSASRLGQVFVNLLINAAQAIPEGRPAEHEVRVVAYRAASGGVVVEVTDTGSGIAPDVLGHVFDPFFTTKPHGVGTGLGLWICHGIVKSAGGEITVESNVGRGSTFRVVLPEWTGAQPDGNDRARPASRPIKRSRVLVIDDERAIGASLALLLEAEHDVTTVTDARIALDALLAGATCDVILCDLMMPRMSGMELYEALRERAPAYARRVVFVTGGAFTPSSRSFLERVPNRRLEKPFDLEALQAALAAVVEENRALETTP